MVESIGKFGVFGFFLCLFCIIVMYNEERDVSSIGVFVRGVYGLVVEVRNE